MTVCKITVYQAKVPDKLKIIKLCTITYVIGKKRIEHITYYIWTVMFDTQ
jgi:hypothetical protein